MRPGFLQWATDALYAAGADLWSGKTNKGEPAVGKLATGRIPEEPPPAEEYNWLANRFALIQNFMAKIFCSNWELKDNGAFPPGGETLGASCNMVDATNGATVTLFFYPPAGGNITERYARDGVSWAPPASSPVAAAVGAVNSIDADSDGAGNRIVTASMAVGTDQVFYAPGFGGGAWGLSGWAPGAPTLNWISVGSDRGVGGGGTYSILIGDSGAGAPQIWLSTNGGATFANVATFPALAGAENVYFIGHTLHAAGDLGQDDTGNARWLILTTTRSLYSLDGVTWVDQAHGFGAAATKRCAAYSKVGRRWVAVIGAGNTFYSDDGGATWNVGAILPLFAGTNPMIACDGYGTFVIGTLGFYCWVSTDNGITWTRIALENSAGATANNVEVQFDEAYQWDSHGTYPTTFLLSFQKTGAGAFHETFRSIVY